MNGDIPGRLNANLQDRLNNAVRNRLSNQQSQAVLELRGRINERRLAKAVRLLLDAEPILGCRFIEEKHRPYWQRFDDLEDREWFSMEKTPDRRKAVYGFLTMPLDGEQQVKVKLIRSAPNDTLCVKISHACCDGGGLKAYQHMLADIYTRLSRDGSYALERRAGGRTDQNHILCKVGMANIINNWRSGQNALQPTWSFPSGAGESGGPRVSVRRLSGPRLKALSTYAKERGATLNDLFLTAFYRTLFEMAGSRPGTPREILVTVDLRRYLGDGDENAVNNLTGAVSARIAPVPGESFVETLSRVAAATAEMKSKLPGIQMAFFLGFLSLLNYTQTLGFVRGLKKRLVQTGKCSPILSNVGFISRSTIWFGKTPVVDAYQVSPAIYPPGFMLGVCTYNNRLTFTVSYCEPGTPREKVERFLDTLLKELESCGD
ncbi:MAG: condensation domain-containing protein [Bacillota bacterium]